MLHPFTNNIKGASTTVERSAGYSFTTIVDCKEESKNRLLDEGKKRREDEKNQQRPLHHWQRSKHGSKMKKRSEHNNQPFSNNILHTIRNPSQWGTPHCILTMEDSLKASHGEKAWKEGRWWKGDGGHGCHRTLAMMTQCVTRPAISHMIVLRKILHYL